jgi:hypothetical protein
LVIKTFMTFETFHIFIALIFYSILSLNVELNLRHSILIIKALMTFETFHIFLAFF